LTAFYMTRAIWLTFFGEYRGHGHPHESPWVMTGPLVILAGLSAVAGFFGGPFVEGGFRGLVHFGEEVHAAGFDVGLAALSVGLALAGVLLGTALYRTHRARDPLTRLGPVYTVLERKYYLDDIYLKGIVRPIQYSVSRFVNWTNQRLLDGLVNGSAWLTRRFGSGTDAVDRYVVDGAVNRVAIGAGWTGGLLRYIQSGNVQRYAVILFAGVAILTALLTAFYMTRAIWLTFFGEYRGHGHPHESPRVMTGPLVILAGLSAVAGFFGAPFVEGGFRQLVHLGEEAHVAGFDFALAALSVGLGLAGILLGTALYRTYRHRDPLTRLGPLYTLLERKYFLDDIYLKGIVRPIQYSVSRFVNWTNQRVLDGLVNGSAWLTRRFGSGTDAVDRHVVDGAVNRVAIGAGWTGGLLRYIQSGNVQRYAVILFAGVAILAVIYTRI
ncbi:MAG: hypothetical protein ACRDIW_02225, partial [Actinomycetota bacterium]